MTPAESQQAHMVDIILMALAFIVPAYLVYRFKLVGGCLGALFSWVALIVAGHFLSAIDPSREGGINDGIWILFGWIFCLLYAAILYGVRSLIMQIVAKCQPAEQSNIPPPPYQSPDTQDHPEEVNKQ